MMTRLGFAAHPMRLTRGSCGVLLGCLLGVSLLTCGLLRAPSAAAAVPSFGAEGQGAGEFTQPRGIAVSQAAGEVFVVDRNNSRIDVFNRSGAFVRAFGWGVANGSEALQSCTTKCLEGVEGPGSGEFSLPEGVAVDNNLLSASHGDIYVGDARNHRVQKFTPTGEFLLMIGGEVNAATKANLCVAGEACQAGSEGPGPGQFESTSAIAVDSTGTLYVGDRDRVQKFSPAGALLGEVKLPASGWIEALAVDAAKDLYVKSSELSGVRKYDSTGTELGSPRDETGAPNTLTLGPSEELLVDTEGAHHILAYDPSGAQLSSFDAGGESGSGIAFDEVAAVLYVLNQTAVRVLEVPPPGPLVASESSEQLQPTSATLRALVNPEEKASADGELKYHFEYGETASYGTSTASEPSTGASFEDRPVTAALTGLLPRTLYHFRVVLENAAGKTTFGSDQSFTTLPPVSIDGESVSQVSASSARLQADLNPHGLPTEFHFEYGPTAAYGSSVPVPDASAGSGTEDESFSLLIQGLTAATTYHYRLVAHNSLGTTEGPDMTFVTQGGELNGLLDGRMWELVSPANKHGTSLESITEEGGLIQAAEDGSGLAYIANGPVQTEVEGNRSISRTQLLAKRESGSWQTRDITTPHENPAGIELGRLSEYRNFSSDLSAAFVVPMGATKLAPQATEPTPYLRENTTNRYVPLLYPGDVPLGTKWGGTVFNSEQFETAIEFHTATPDGRHALLNSTVPLTEGGGENLYEWSEGVFTAVGLTPTPPATTCGGEGPACAQTGEAGYAGERTVSSDGNRIAFRIASGGGASLYLRDIARNETVQVDAPEPATSGHAGHMTLPIISPDGHRVFFKDSEHLTTDATAKPEEGGDLYMCTIEVVGGHLSCNLKDLSVDPNPGEAAQVQAKIIATDTSGAVVYFVANGALTPKAVHGDCTGKGSIESSATESCNLYVYDAASKHLGLVAVLSARDSNDWGAKGAEGSLEDPGALTARVSPNGRWFTFMSRRPLTKFDNRDARTGEPDEEVFLYDESKGELRCVSCSATGARPAGVFDEGEFPGLLVDRPGLWGLQGLAGSIPGWTRVSHGEAKYQSRYLSDEGRLFFNSAVGLVPADSNGKEDVYEFEPAGIGGCTQPNGCQALISSGTSAEESAFLDASATGEDVFFLTAAKLVGSDTDTALDVYDAHVCTTALACPSGVVSVPPECTTADSCRAAPAPQPTIFGAPASATFTGVGNVTSPPVKPAVKPLTRAQKLAKALKACRTKHNKHKRTLCEKQARHTYATARKAKRANTHRRASR